MAQPIGTLGTVPTLTIGGCTLTDLTSNLIIATGGGTTASHFNATLRKYGAGAGYQVTTGKTFTARILEVFSVNATYIELVQSDNDTGQDSTTAFTNPIYEFAANTQHVTGVIVASASNILSQRAPFMPFQALKYVSAVSNSGGWSARVYGYEA